MYLLEGGREKIEIYIISHNIKMWLLEGGRGRIEICLISHNIKCGY